jgi:hypothetical protein
MPSKFIHGCATLLPSRVDLIPFWLPQSLSFPSSDRDTHSPVPVETDIHKPDTGKVSISRPTPAPSHTNTDSTTTPEMHSPLALGDHHYTEPVSEGEDDEAMAIAMPKSENDAARVPLAAALEAIAWREQQRREREVEMEKRRTEGRLNGNEGLPEDGQEVHEGTPFLRRHPPKSQESRQRNQHSPLTPLLLLWSSTGALRRSLDAVGEEAEASAAIRVPRGGKKKTWPHSQRPLAETREGDDIHQCLFRTGR